MTIVDLKAARTDAATRRRRFAAVLATSRVHGIALGLAGDQRSANPASSTGATILGRLLRARATAIIRRLSGW